MTVGEDPQRFENRTEEFHYTEIHSALENWRDEEMPGKITRIEYPNDGSHGMVRVFFTEVVDGE